MTMRMCGADGVAEQADFATAATPPDVWINLDGGVFEEDNTMFTPQVVSNRFGTSIAAQGPSGGTVPIAMRAFPGEFLSWMMKWLYNDVTTTDLLLGAYQHTYKSLSGCGSVIPFTYYQDVGESAFNLIGAVVGDFNLTVDAADMLNIAFNCPFCKPERVDKIAGFDPEVVTPLIWADGTIKIGGVEMSDAENFNLTIDRAVEPKHTIGGNRWPKQQKQKGWNITAGFLTESDILLSKRRNWGDITSDEPTRKEWTSSFDASFVSAEEIGSSGEYYTFRIYMPRVVYSAVSLEGGAVTDDVKVAVTMMPLIPLTDGSCDDEDGNPIVAADSDVTIIMKNATSSLPDA